MKNVFGKYRANLQKEVLEVEVGAKEGVLSSRDFKTGITGNNRTHKTFNFTISPEQLSHTVYSTLVMQLLDSCYQPKEWLRPPKNFQRKVKGACAQRLKDITNLFRIKQANAEQVGNACAFVLYLLFALSY